MHVRLRASYARVGRVAGRPAARYFHSISLAPARSWPLRSMLLFSRSKLLRVQLSSTVARAHRPRRGTVRGTSLPSRLAPRSNLNYHFTLPFERAAAAATAETQAADSPVYLSSAPFSLCFSLSLPVSSGERSFSRSMRSPTVRAGRKRRAF